MFDAQLRTWKDALLAPLAKLMLPIHPLFITIIGLFLGLGSAVAAALGLTWIALGLWLVNRLADGLDGFVARIRGLTSPRGAYLDLVVDFVVYAAIPLGLAYHEAELGAWIMVALWLGACYINACSWLTLSALLEKSLASTIQGSQAPTGTRVAPEDGLVKTGITMPRGLMEGAETIVLYGFCLMAPQLMGYGFGIGALLVLVSSLQRIIWAWKHLA